MKPGYTSRLAQIEGLIRADTAAHGLESETRRSLGSLWARRAQTELTASVMFDGLTRDCSSSTLPRLLTEQSARAANDERFHSLMCARIAEHYCGEAPLELTPGEDALRFESCEPELALGLRLLLHCALNETVSVAYLQECHKEAVSPLVRAAARQLLQDEIHHSRIGWAYLGALELETRLSERFRRELPRLLSLVASAWYKPVADTEYPDGHGVLSLACTRKVADLALETLVKPGLASFGLIAR